jgi:mediator of RNA polymerase II transcription subunit 7
MAEQPQANALASAFPTPPPFWQHFTPENISRIEELRAAQSGPEAKPVDPADGLPLRILDLPPELRWLQPPEPPSNGIYRCFGDTFNVRNFDVLGYTHNAGQNY